MVAGITGKYCAGKDAASRILEGLGFVEIDEDGVGHRALDEKKDAIVAAFGLSVKAPDGNIDRSKLGSIVFSGTKDLRMLEGIVHPWMVSETAQHIKSLSDQNVVINAAVLFRMGLHTLCDIVLIVKAPLITRILRGLRRDSRGVLHVISRMKFQPSADIHGHSLKKSGIPVDIYTVRNGRGKKRLAGRVSRILDLYGISGR
ncbi:MAG: dephospho-CoA kinase [Spirochaetales bacterium]|nr:dephospho-CoA kinase [Spirochaetales bacterium]